jgi:peptidoglycan/LPS O-acetylase OafA/YrhL
MELRPWASKTTSSMRTLKAEVLSPQPTVVAASAPTRMLGAAYFPAFDWLRAALAITVMLAHDRVFAWANSGPFAVQVFFALSGWLIGGILLKTPASGLPHFYFNRALRIWVPYYVALMLLVAASLLKDHVNGKWAEFVTYKLFMVWNVFGTSQLAQFSMQMPLQGTGNHFWSVNAEEQFYLVSPLLIVLAPRWGRSPLVWLALSALALASQTIYGAILLGVLAATAVERYGAFHVSSHAKKSLALIGATCAVGLYLGGNFQVFSSMLGLAAVLLLAVPGKASPLGKIAGGMSYPLYLNHWIGVFVGNALLSPFGLRDSGVRQIFASLFSIGFAVVLYLLIDRQVQARRNSWYSDRRGRDVRLMAYAMVCAGVAFGTLVLASKT